MSLETLLVVDDETIIRSTLAEVLLSFGYDCRMAGDGLEALDLIKSDEFDMILSDIRMPRLNGLELMDKTREIRPDASFIMMTGYTREYTFDEIIDAGAVDLITKPFKINEIRFKIERAFRERLLAKENERLLKEQGALSDKLSAILEMSKNLTAAMSFDRLLDQIIRGTTRIMEAERTSLYLIDWEQREIWTKVAQQVESIRVPIGQGISGRVAENGEKINVKDAWKLPYFKREYDIKNHFRTRSVLCLPIFNRERERIGVFQVLNKKDKSQFDQNDEIILEAIASQVAITLENHFLIDELQISFESSIRTLSATVDARHPLTAGHSQRVTEYSLMIAKELGLNEKELEVIKYAALLHDIGKIGIPDSVLLKQGRFTPEERSEMNEHPARTRDILENFHFPRALSRVPIIASQHHEKVNGQGYPSGLGGGELPLSSKILAVSDVFDALTSPRDYPKYCGEKTLSYDPMPLSKAINILRDSAGSHFDPEVVEAFIKCLPRAIEMYRGMHFSHDYINEYLHTSPILQAGNG